MGSTDKCVNIAVRTSDREYLNKLKKTTGKPIYKIVNEILSNQMDAPPIEPVPHYAPIHWEGEKPFKNFNVRTEDYDFVEQLAAEKGTFKYGALQELISVYKQVKGLEDEQ